MTMDAIDRVARAIFIAEERMCCQEGDPWEKMLHGDYDRGPYRRMARAAIEELREPTEAMIAASLRTLILDPELDRREIVLQVLTSALGAVEADRAA